MPKYTNSFTPTKSTRIHTNNEKISWKYTTYLCASMNGIEPYKAIGLLSSYSNTSRLNKRYGSRSLDNNK